MQKLLCIILMLALTQTTNAQRFRERRMPRPNALLVGGIVSASLGMTTAGFGGIIYILSDKDSRGRTAVPVIAAGGVMLAGGIVMICVGARQMRDKRFSVVAPKPNQVGIAFSLTAR